MSSDRGDTIFALSSGAPPAAIAIVRISGPAAFPTADRIARGPTEPRRATLRRLHARDGDLIDQALVLRFPAPDTTTGEDLVEFHLHGGRAVVARMLEVLRAETGLRLAEPGEFTRRGFLNGRIDLLQAEGLADLLTAETEQQRRAALHVAEGGLSRHVADWHDMLVALSARVEALIEFEDDSGDVVMTDLSTLHIALVDLAADLQTALAAPPAERLRDGIRVVIAGPPNAGKSSLLNTLIGRDAAIVTDMAGTTRDVIEAPVMLRGVAFLFCDTAGLRDTDDPIEGSGIARARDRIDTADLVLWLSDDPPEPAGQATLWIYPRCDLAGRETAPLSARPLSVVSGAGMQELLDWLIHESQHLLPLENSFVLSERQRRAIEGAAAALLQASLCEDIVLTAEHLREARTFFYVLTGRGGLDAVLDSIFGQFCLGK